jgi:hypothetical protein
LAYNKNRNIYKEINMLMERIAEIIRGWPYDGSLERVEPITAGASLQNGDWVTKQSDGTVNKVGATATNAAGLVIVGNLDSASAAYSNEAVVLWGNFLAKISNYASGSYTQGQALTVKNGVITGAAAGNGSATPVTFGDPVIGFVLDVVAASSTGYNPQTAHLVIKVG